MIPELKEGVWNHLLLCWDRVEQRLDLYCNGEFSDKIFFDNFFRNSSIIEFNGGSDSGVSIDEIFIYNRFLSIPQAKFMFESFARKKNRLGIIKQRLAEDDRIAQERKELVAKLKGLVGYVSHHKHSKAKTFKFPGEDVVAECINPTLLGKVDLSKFKVIWFPKGPHFEIEPEQFKYIVEYVENGGGYVGSCQGSYFANKIKLIDFEARLFNIWGVFKIKHTPHVVNDFSSGVDDIHFGNGPIIVPGEGIETIAHFDMELPGNFSPSAIVAAKRGKGRVVLFAPHPTGGVISKGGVRGYYQARDLRTGRMAINALLYAAKLTENKEVKNERY
jgi:hypothetical protein